MLRNKISSNIQDLNELHRAGYWWIPDETMIRPSLELIQQKALLKQELLESGTSLKDYIIRTHFKDGEVWAFQKSVFPYNLSAGANHYSLWNRMFDCSAPIGKSLINRQITNRLKELIGNDQFDFVWYVNPKLSIPELWHCQVFWITI